MRMHPTAPAHRHEDPSEIGHAFMKALPDDATWRDSPVEYFTNVLRELEQLRGAPAPSGPLKLDTDRQVFFYEQDFYVLSNFSSFTLQWAELRFDTAEAAYHWEKFVGTPHDDVRALIRFAPSAHEAYKVAAAHRQHRRADWAQVKLDVMGKILRAKALQHEYVRRKLLDTGDRELVENSWRDDFWGWGPNRDGRNMLGKLWMEIRTEMRVRGAYSDRAKARTR